MKQKFVTMVVALILCCPAFAAQVSQQTAASVALNYFKLNSTNNTGATLTTNLVYTKKETDGTIDFYVFDITPVKGFVIVTGQENTEPVIGYSTESNFDLAAMQNTGLGDWMNTAAAKITTVQRLQIQPDNYVQTQWASLIAGVNANSSRAGTVGPLLTTTWNQEPYYNALCPYNSTDAQRCVTGCVATAMAQIMRYWKYPAQGTGSYSYNDAQPNFSNNYGVQSANFGATTYNWNNMPNSISAANNDVATLCYQAGVAVAMDYGDDNQGGSGAAVLSIQSGGGPCAQKAYSIYFGYNASAMQGVLQANYTSTAWITLIQNELNAGRVIQYQGFDPGAGGHTWVCDGYQSTSMFHMNWGWGGYGNGYFSLSSLSVAGFTFSSNDGALIGIQPNTAGTTCNAPASTSTSLITSSSATFNWGAASGAVSYNVQYRKVGTTAWSAVNTTVNSYNATGLTAATNYEWQVQTICSSGSSAFTSSATFTTSAGATCNVPMGLTSGSIASTSATLSWTAVSGATSYGLQWKPTSGSSWTTISGLATNNYGLSGLVACTAYQFQVLTNCSSGSSAYSSTGSFSTVGCPTSYCTSKASSTTYEYISKVSLGTINNTSGNNHGYADYTGQSTNLAGNSNVTITLTPGFTGTAYTEDWKVYIDYNHNGVFTDAGENVASLSGKTAVSKTITVPTTALNGTTRMRIQMEYGTYASTPCTSYTYGEVEDYTVNITGNAHLSLDVPTEEIVASLSEVTLYPNPAQQYITLQYNSGTDAVAHINIYNITGQRVAVFEKTANAGVNTETLSTDNMDSGAYILEIESKGTISRQRFIVAK